MFFSLFFIFGGGGGVFDFAADFGRKGGAMLQRIYRK